MKNFRKNASAGLLIMIAGVIVTFGAMAEDTRGHGPIPFSEFDQDGDGFISEEEFNAVRGQRLAVKPGDRDAAWCKGHGMGEHGHMGDHKGMGEGRHMKGNMPAYADFDLDGDGKVVEQEFNEVHAERISEMAAKGYPMKHLGDCPGFSGIDTDGNGEISEAEFSSHQSRHHQEMRKHRMGVESDDS